MRTKITLACTECKQRNYNTTKDKKTHPDRRETKKYCRFCKTHTMHKETKESAVLLKIGGQDGRFRRKAGASELQGREN